MVENTLESGRLIRPFLDGVQTAFSYYIVYPRGMFIRPEVVSFIDWLINSASIASCGRRVRLIWDACRPIASQLNANGEVRGLRNCWTARTPVVLSREFTEQIVSQPTGHQSVHASQSRNHA